MTIGSRGVVDRRARGISTRHRPIKPSTTEGQIEEMAGSISSGDVAAHVAEADPHTQYQQESEKGAVGGYASLDGGGTVPDVQIPAGVARDAEVTAAITAHEGAADPHAGYQKESEEDANGGYSSYEFDDWTPGLSFVGGAVGIAYANQAGTYERIGRQVTVRGVVELSAKGTSVGQATITGLPFPIGSGAKYNAAGSVNGKNITFSGTLLLRTNHGTSTLQLNENTEAGAENTITEANFSDTSRVLFSLTYAT